VSEGEIVYSGTYTVDGLDLSGRGKSTIYQGESVYGSEANDVVAGLMDPSNNRVEGEIISTSSSHASALNGATFEFELESE
jgi:hypothetical protein